MFNVILVADEENNMHLYDQYLEYVEEMQDQVNFDTYLNDIALEDSVHWSYELNTRK